MSSQDIVSCGNLKYREFSLLFFKSLHEER